MSKLNELQAQQFRVYEEHMTEKEKKNFKLSHELSKIIFERPLDLEVGGEDNELAVRPEQKDMVGKSVKFAENDRRRPVKRTVVGGIDKYKDYIKGREREAHLKEKLAQAIKK